MCSEAERAINKFLKRAELVFPVPEVNFANQSTLNFNDDIDLLYQTFDNVDQQHTLLAKQIKEQCEEYIQNVMVPKMLKLEVIILLQAFNVRGKPIIDLFYTYNNKSRVMRDPVEFCFITGGGFMSLFYKVNINIQQTSFVMT